ncbi:uncharacterized protein [Nicotiana tomentosiformis]|uniref:uncharacterized protein isoform X5 n=1 Tax=Nicotiana tomentosiformis TaxID=4098 RepID=UPI00388C8395
MQGTQRSEIRLCESEKIKTLRGTNWCKNITGLKAGDNVVPPGFDQIFEGPCESEKVKKVRGTNMCKKVGGLKVRETLHVTFYHNRVVGQHHASFTRHLGILVCDHNMCPLHVHSWADIEKYKLQYTWEAVTDKFDSDDINNQLDHVLKHMRKLWNN